jgi:hypothetical protein
MSATPYGPAEYEDDEATCPKCGESAEWIDCFDCGGEGDYDGFELDPLWYGTNGRATCNLCDGDGGWHFCRSCQSK